MKKETTKQNTTESQIRCSIKDAFAGTRVKLNQMNLKVTATNGDFNIFLNQNLGKGPPGRTRSPVAARGHPPANKAGPPANKADPPDSNSYYYNEVQLINTNTKFNLLQTFNSLIMKKQILFIALFVLAVFASVNKSYGQALAPRAMTCLTSDALHPIAGQPYTYAIDVPALPAGAKTYNWLVTQDASFIAAGVLTTNIQTTAGSLLFATGTGYNAPGTTATPGTGAPTQSITWKSFVYDPTAPVFVVIEVKGLTTGTGACETSNLKVFKIVPVNAFTLDIANLATGATPDVAGALADATYGAEIFKCIHNIVSATYSATAPEGVIYDFGTDYLFFEVVAANFNASWRPSFQLTNVDPLETVTVEWSKSKSFPAASTVTMAGSAVGTGATATTYTSPTGSDVTATVTGGAVGASGESIYVRVTLDHTNGTLNYQGLAAEQITLAVDGLTNLSAAAATDYIGDVHYANGQLSAGPPVVCNTPAVDGYTNDIAHQTINPRPTVAAVAATPTPGFLLVKP